MLELTDKIIMTTLKVFLTGATGYIGGEVLYQLLNNKTHNFEVTALVRSQEKADLLTKATNNKVIPVIGSLDSLEVIEKQVNENEIIINTANVDHVPSAKVLADTLAKKKSKAILIHTSGTSVIGDEMSESKKPSTKIYYDDKNIDEINSLPLEQPHRPVDAIILDINERNPNIETAIISPSAIFGQSDGYDKIVSAQVPYLIALSVANDQAFSVYGGKYIWSRVHIKDLGDLYMIILDKLINGSSIPKGREGYYFGSYTVQNEDPITEKPSEIEHYWSDVSKAIAENLYKRKQISKSDVAQLKPDQVIKLSKGNDFAPYLWCTNSRSRGENGIKIGWKPQYVDAKYFWDSIPGEVDYFIKNSPRK